MRRYLLVFASALSALTLAGAASAENERPHLRFDPFLKPNLEPAADAPTASIREGEWAPVLNATLVAGEQSFANLGGVVLAIGEESHGYRLIEVRRWEAVFEHAGDQKVLPVAARGEER